MSSERRSAGDDGHERIDRKELRNGIANDNTNKRNSKWAEESGTREPDAPGGVGGTGWEHGAGDGGGCVGEDRLRQ